VRVLAVDPGREKCGIAVCAPGAVLDHRVVAAQDFERAVREWAAAYGVDRVVVGSGTGARAAAEALRGLLLPVVEVNEAGTTLAARARYFAEHPPSGWKRLIPRSLLVPPEAYDDYAAILLGESYLRAVQRGA
jgi:RNase H-fold protein (predicted Holliday junction resolvase)